MNTDSPPSDSELNITTLAWQIVQISPHAILNLLLRRVIASLTWQGHPLKITPFLSFQSFLDAKLCFAEIAIILIDYYHFTFRRNC